jgi:hypothetical protein
LLIMLGVAWGFTQIAPRHTASALAVLRESPAMSMGIGGLVWALLIPSLVALCLVVAILCITIIGIPVAIAALFAYGLFLGLVWVWGYVVCMAAIGEWVLSRRAQAAPVAGVAPGAFPSGPQIAPAAARESSLTQNAVLGVLLIGGAGFVGQIFKTIDFIGPLRALGSFLSVISIVLSGLAATIGAGAWLRSEFVSGTLKRWWGGRRTSPAVAVAESAAGAQDQGGTAPAAPPTPPV